MAIISVFGHKNPDNDAISAAVGAAYLMTNIDQENEYVPVRLGDMPKETQWVADTYGYAAPEYVASVADLPHEEGCKPKVFLVDHNESTQSIDGLADADVVGIIDHHRIGDVQTAGPIYVTCRPWGSSSTVITTLLEQAGLGIPVPIAAALLSALLTDTIIMRSPTTTQIDHEVAARLGRIVGVDPAEFGAKVFKSRGGDEGKTAEFIISHDAKEFEFGGQRVMIAQHETVDLEGLKGRVDEIQAAMDAVLADKGYDTVLVLLTDIIEEGSLFLISGDRALVEKTFECDFNAGEVYIPGILSRKKQVAARLIEMA